MKTPNPGGQAGAGGGDDRQDVAPDIPRHAPPDNQPDLERALDELPGALKSLWVCALCTGVGIGAVVGVVGMWWTYT
jgi:hypothetical protein